MDQPRVGTHYPRSTGEFEAEFRADADCTDYLDLPRLVALAWRFHMSVRRSRRAWRLGDGRYERADCNRRTSVTAATILDRTQTPLTV
jgi:hypothetical protein